MTAHLPVPGVDRTGWGTTLNEYLGVSHNADGTLKSSAVSAVLVFNVKDYGATGNGATNDQPFIQLASDAISAAGGGYLYFPRPAQYYRIDSPIVIGAPCIVQGDIAYGTNTARGVRIVNSSGATNAFTVGSEHVHFRHLAIINSNAVGSVTAGAAIYFSSGNYSSVEFCRIMNHFNGIEIDAGYGWSINTNYIGHNKNYSVFIKDVGGEDFGDQVMMGNYVVTDSATWPTAAHIRYESGGGAKIIGNKFLQAARALDIAVEDGASTSILEFVGNSIEATKTSCIRVARKGTTGVYKRVMISNNQFSANDCTSDVIEIGAAGISETMISNNLMWASGTQIGIHVKGGDNHTITDNSLSILLTGITFDLGHTNSYVRGNKFQSCATFMADGETSPSAQSHIEWEGISNFSGVTTTNTATPENVFRVELKSRHGVHLEVCFQGIVNTNIGGFSALARRVGVLNSGGSNVTLATVGADTQVSGPIQMVFTTTTAGVILIGLARDAADGGTSISGSCTIKVAGGVKQVLPL